MECFTVFITINTECVLFENCSALNRPHGAFFLLGLTFCTECQELNLRRDLFPGRACAK